MCRKVHYRSKVHAAAARARLGRRQLGIYRCRECKGRVYHLGHYDGWEKFVPWLKGEINL